MPKVTTELDKYLQWKYETIAGMTKKEFAELMKQLLQGNK